MTATMTQSRIDQREAALERANAIRSARGRMKKDLNAGRISTKHVLTELPEYAETMRVAEFLVSLRRIGQVKAGEILHELGVGQTRRLCDLTARQRGLLILNLGRRGC